MVLPSAGCVDSRLETTALACLSISGSAGAGVAASTLASQPMTFSSFCGWGAAVSVVMAIPPLGSRVGIGRGPARDLLQVGHRGLHADGRVGRSGLHVGDGGQRLVHLRERLLVLGEQRLDAGGVLRRELELLLE